eukprot:gnl/MRDRNA2_/MRDRNA2_128236_c0_seq1.p1 gnl/MRDRNA2_/MRDRNA2_128236_c0~~gnl/MRDRNA2_/MRDRNA2_128236_c0_seq1.p1  ORF type:complete len:204 (-),score=31.94 gnl/MRDRNA2_/MRDRNA2_128236_c0_seq1:19-543(-)
MPTTVHGVLVEKDKGSNKPTFAPTELPTTVPSWYIKQEEEEAKSASSATEVPSRISRASSGGRDTSNMRNLAADVALPDQMETVKPGYISFLREIQNYGASLVGARCFSLGLYWFLGFTVTASMVWLCRQNKDSVPVDECTVVSLKPMVTQAPDSKGLLYSGDATGSSRVKMMS